MDVPDLLVNGMLKKAGVPGTKQMKAEHPHGLLLPENDGASFLGTDRVLTAMLTAGTQVGRTGCERRGMPASAGVRLPFLLLQRKQAVTMLVQFVAPPRDRGRTWS